MTGLILGTLQNDCHLFGCIDNALGNNPTMFGLQYLQVLSGITKPFLQVVDTRLVLNKPLVYLRHIHMPRFYEVLQVCYGDLNLYGSFEANAETLTLIVYGKNFARSKAFVEELYAKQKFKAVLLRPGHAVSCIGNGVHLLRYDLVMSVA
jgi:hypothetical protein